MPDQPANQQREEDFHFPPRKILVAVDGSSNSFRAVEIATKIAKRFGAEMRILYVLQSTSALLYAISGPGTPAVLSDQYFESAEDEATSFLGRMMSVAKGNGVHCTEEIVRTTSSIVNTIVLDAKAQSIDLIIIGTRGLGGFGRMLLGSISSGVVAHAGCSVLVVR